MKNTKRIASRKFARVLELEELKQVSGGIDGSGGITPDGDAENEDKSNL